MEARAAIPNAISKFLTSRPSAILAISATALLTVDSVAPPRRAIRSEPRTATPRAFARAARQARRRSVADGDGDVCSGGWDGGDGSFGGGGSGGGRWWNSGGSDWGEWGSPTPSSDPAFDVVYGVICCVALYNCTGFALKRLFRFLDHKTKIPPLSS